MKTELYKDLFESRNPGDENESRIREMWKSGSHVRVLNNGVIEEGWKIVGVFSGEGDEPLRVRVANRDGTFQLMADAREFLG